MTTTLIIAAVCYLAIVSIVLVTFRFMRDRNMAEAEYSSGENA
jgi:hypothetical protein